EDGPEEFEGVRPEGSQEEDPPRRARAQSGEEAGAKSSREETGESSEEVRAAEVEARGPARRRGGARVEAGKGIPRGGKRDARRARGRAARARGRGRGGSRRHFGRRDARGRGRVVE